MLSTNMFTEAKFDPSRRLFLKGSAAAVTATGIALATDINPLDTAVNFLHPQQSKIGGPLIVPTEAKSNFADPNNLQVTFLPESASPETLVNKLKRVFVIRKAHAQNCGGCGSCVSTNAQGLGPSCPGDEEHPYLHAQYGHVALYTYPDGQFKRGIEDRLTCIRELYTVNAPEFPDLRDLDPQVKVSRVWEYIRSLQQIKPYTEQLFRTTKPNSDGFSYLVNLKTQLPTGSEPRYHQIDAPIAGYADLIRSDKGGVKENAPFSIVAAFRLSTESHNEIEAWLHRVRLCKGDENDPLVTSLIYNTRVDTDNKVQPAPYKNPFVV